MLLLSATPRWSSGESSGCLNVSAAALCCVVAMYPCIVGFFNLAAFISIQLCFFPCCEILFSHLLVSVLLATLHLCLSEKQARGQCHTSVIFYKVGIYWRLYNKIAWPMEFVYMDFSVLLQQWD